MCMELGPSFPGAGSFGGWREDANDDQRREKVVEAGVHPLCGADGCAGACGPGAAELDRVKWTAVAFWVLAVALVAAVEMGIFK